MNELLDQELLRQYVERKSDSAFAALVERYIDLVHSAAFRMSGDPHSAQDITQCVFVALSQNARQLTDRPTLAGWLHTTARNLAAKEIRSQIRRRSREQEAIAMNELLTADAAANWDEVAPHLDAALGDLSDPERDAVLLRYFKNEDLRTVGATLGISDDAAQKRVSRAVEHLRELIARRGVTVGASGLAVVISANAVQAAPAGLALTISTAVALTGTTLTAAATTTKVIAMTTLQKTVVTATIAGLTGFGVYEARQASQLRKQVALLQQQVESLTARAEVANPPEAAPVILVSETAPVTERKDIASDWAARLLALNAGDWRQAFAAGEQLASLPPDTGLAILRDNWNAITNVPARQQLIKAFTFASHDRLPAVLELGLLDASPAVQSWALNYLKEVALQDFTTDFAAAREWLAMRRDSTLAEAFTDATWQAVSALRNSTGEQLLAQLKLIKGASDLFAKFPQAIVPSGLDQVLAGIAAGNDVEAAALVLQSASRMPLGEDWYRAVALPLLTEDGDKDSAVKVAAARALSTTKREWALAPILDTLTSTVYSAKGHPSVPTSRVYVWDLASALAEHGSPKAIPAMIALIEAENTYNTIYGIGYYGLNKMTGVEYDQKHDGKWWRQWWENNRQRFPADVQALEIPKLDPIPQANPVSVR